MMMEQIAHDPWLLLAMCAIVAIMVPVLVVGGILVWQLRKALKGEPRSEAEARMAHSVDGP